MGTFVVRREGIAVCTALLVCLACGQPVKRIIKPGAEPQVRATVVSVQTRTTPENKTRAYPIVIAGDRARSMNEVDRWRLIDLKQNNVTFVDDIAKTYRTMAIRTLIEKRPRNVLARLTVAGATRSIQGVTARQWNASLHAYRRELWIGEHPSVPSNLYAVLEAADDVPAPVDEAIISMRGFPLAEHAELPYGKSKMVLDREVVKIEQRDVPQSWLNVPSKYKDVTTPAAGRPPVSSPPPSPGTPAAGSPPSSTTQKTP